MSPGWKEGPNSCPTMPHSFFSHLQGFKSPNPFDAASTSPYGKQMSPRGNSHEVAPKSRWDVSAIWKKVLLCAAAKSLFPPFFSLKTFQRIQRNRQSRIRVKLSRRAAKRQDEILEEEDQEPPKQQHQKSSGSKTNTRQGR